MRKKLLAVTCSVLGAAGCSSVASSPSDDESVGVAQSAITDDNTGAPYNNDCYSTYHVPPPPQWNSTTTTNGTWTNRGPYSDTFTGDFNGRIYSWVSNDASAPGICVANSHNYPEPFDIICQGTNGNACFWEGPNVSSPPASGTPTVSTGSGCSGCHAGENVFLTHYSLPGQPQHPTNLNGSTGWMPSWYSPIINHDSGQNSDPGMGQVNSFRPSTSNCLNCHSGSPGGRFPSLSPGAPFCSVALSAVVDRPSVGGGTIGGMPPVYSNGSLNTCTPGVSCARETDPFVQDMLSACGLTPPTWVYAVGAVPNYRGTLSGNGTGFTAGIYAVGTNYRIYQWTGTYWFLTDGAVASGDHPTISVGANGNAWTFINSTMSLYLAPPNSCIPNNGVCHWQQFYVGTTISQVAAGDGAHPWLIDAGGGGVYRFDGSTFQLEIAGSWPGRTTGAKLVQIAVGNDGDAWVVDSHGVTVHREATGWVQRTPFYGGGSGAVNAISVTDATHVWASTSSPLGIFNYYPGTLSWQHHCPLSVPGGGNACNTTNSRFVAIGASADSPPDVWAVNTAGQVYRVDNNQVVNHNNSNSDDYSLFNTPSPVSLFSQVISTQSGPMAVAPSGSIYRYE